MQGIASKRPDEEVGTFRLLYPIPCSLNLNFKKTFACPIINWYMTSITMKPWHLDIMIIYAHLIANIEEINFMLCLFWLSRHLNNYSFFLILIFVSILVYHMSVDLFMYITTQLIMLRYSWNNKNLQIWEIYFLSW